MTDKMKCTNLTHKENCDCMNNKVIKLSDASDNALHWTPIEMIEYAKEAIQKEELTGRKAILIVLDDEKREFNVKPLNARCKNSDLLAIAEILKIGALRDMEYID